MGCKYCHCLSLEKLALSRSLKKIEKRIVSYCGKLKYLELPDEVHVITDQAFERNEFLEEIALSKDLEIIGKEAFSKCYSLERLRLNDGLKRIKYRAFYNCYSLCIDYLPASLEVVEEAAFYGVQLSEEIRSEVEVRFPLALSPGQQYEAEVDFDSFMDLAQNKYIRQNYEMLVT
ncbi:leucine-rich repeat domain-containing protein [uncultured Porphyromonas sp.]|uniref:leucine-rich repeat domain-containing protein n=1 Tax=uncultured Porphyromonas sp. TaxID=159274 RepID=UPI00258EDA06|nr:leucine-rich repeat domain-containing protein [uncultured Porphyromonas sp.]